MLIMFLLAMFNQGLTQMAYQYQDISELRTNLLDEIEVYFKQMNRGSSFQHEQYSEWLNNILSHVEQETE
jgi:hypothetical protein